jgi:hypothetical protein
MNTTDSRFKEKKLKLELNDVDAKVVYHRYEGTILNTTLVTFPKNAMFFQH